MSEENLFKTGEILVVDYGRPHRKHETPTFIQVIETSEKTVKIQAIQAELVSDEKYRIIDRRPVPDKFLGEPLDCLILDGAAIITSRYKAVPFDPEKFLPFYKH